MNFEITDELLDSISIALEDDVFVVKIAEANDASRIISLFLDKGITINEEIAQSAYDKIVQIKNGDELSEEELNLVAGGKRITWKSFKKDVIWGVNVGKTAANSILDKGINKINICAASQAVVAGTFIGINVGLGIMKR